MRNKYVFILTILLGIIILGGILINIGGGTSKKQTPERDLQIVTSFYPIYVGALNITNNVDGVSLTNLTEPATGCLHDYQLSTDDMVLLGEADVFLINGGGMESFIEEVAKQYPDLKIIETGEAYSATNENPHIWLGLEGYEAQLAAMVQALSEINPDNQSAYHNNLEIYLGELKNLEQKAVELSAKTGGIKVILFHEGFEYLAEMLGMEVVAVLDMDEETSLSSGELSELIDLAKKEEVPYLLCEGVYGKSAANTVAGESDAKVIVIDPLTSGAYEKGAYLTAMENNFEILSDSIRTQ